MRQLIPGSLETKQLPNILILDEILEMVLLLQPAACAISFIDSSPLWIIS
jgi:hypothetical protein